MYGAIVAEMEANAIDTEEFNKKYWMIKENQSLR